MSSHPQRLVLFDIDGTLLMGGSLWKESFLKAFGHFYPNAKFPETPFGGKTDLQIAREVLAAAGTAADLVETQMPQVVDHYVKLAVEQARTRAHEVNVLPGVRPLLDELGRRPEVLLGLLTGNVKQGALAKLACAELEHHFKFGVFGDDNWDRYKLPALAVERVREEFGYEFSGKQIVIIGDTVHDVNCGKSLGVRTIAVGTGKNVRMEDLLAHNPDYYFKDLSSTFEIIQAILE